MTLTPNHMERQLMQQLRGRGWVKGGELPPSSLIGKLLKKGWVEARGTGRDHEYRITEQGMAAKTATILPQRKSKRGGRDREMV
jgi:hypothetical protein